MSVQDDCNRLLNTVMPFAEQMLAEHGEFFPFGAKLKADGKIALAAAHDGDERPPSQSVIDLLQSGFKLEAAQGNLVATALVSDVRVTLPGSGEKSDAVAVDLDHCDNDAMTVFFPYAIANGEVVIGQQFILDRKSTIFPSTNA